MDLIYTPAFIIGASSLWGFFAYRIAQTENHKDFDTKIVIERWIAAVLAISIMATAILLPTPWNLSVSLALAGLGIAAWNDWKTYYLYDEIVFTSAILAGSAMLLGGQGLMSMQGGMVCATITLLIYFTSRAIGKDTGFGDVKHSAAIGFALGPTGGVTAYFFAALAVILISSITMIQRGERYRDVKKREIPFGPALTFGMVLASGTIPTMNLFLQSITA